MIQILDKHNCCGCNSCVQKCPKQCISMHEDEEGFLYPQVDLNQCIDCYLCEKVCPCLNQEEPKEPLTCYAAKNQDESIRRQSSSGGIFTVIAEKVITEGGVVFGARFDNSWQVVAHACAETMDELAVFRESKYVQSRVGNAFKQAEALLKEGRKVLFSGTPCQISGLKHFLLKDFDNLLTVEVVCHGVPSPKIWREYLGALQFSNIGSISHKDKSTGWRDYSFTIKNIEGKTLFTERASNNKYLMAFVGNLTLRPSCFSCPAKAGKSGADITLADYWGIEYLVPQMDDNKGTSFICCNTEKGKALIEQLNLQVQLADYYKSISYNSCIVKSTSKPVERQQFWNEYREQGITALFSLKEKKRNVIKRIIKRIIQ